MGIDGDAAVPPDRRFGEERRLSYGGYHRLPEQVDVLETMTPQDSLAIGPALSFAHRHGLSPASGFEPSRLRRRPGEAMLWDACPTALSQRGLPVSHDETALRRRTRRMRMVERQIGDKSGTRGSTDASTCAVARARTTSRCPGNQEPGRDGPRRTLTKE